MTRGFGRGCDVAWRPAGRAALISAYLAVAACEARPAAGASQPPLRADTGHGTGNARPSPDAGANASPSCIGRIVLTVHDGLEVRSDDAVIEEVSARTAPWGASSAASTTAPDAAAAEWRARLRAVDANPEIRPAGARTAILDERHPTPTVRMLLRSDARSDTSLRVGEALVDAGPHALWLRVGYDPGRETEVVRALSVLGARYRARSPEVTRTATTGGAFCLARGGFLGPFEADERVRVTFDAARWNFSELQVVTDSRGNPDGGSGPIAEWRARIASVAITPHLRGTLVRAGARQVAGLPGEEVVARLTEGSKTSLAFEWASTGPASGPAPYVRVTATSDAGQARALLSRWDGLLDGMRRGRPEGTP